MHERRTMTDESRRRERTAGLFLLGFLIFNYPLVSLFSADFMLLGIPLLYLYLFTCWLLLIVGTARAIGKKPPGPAADEQD